MDDQQRRKSRMQPEMMVGVSAIVIGVCALFVSMYEASLMREEQRAAVIPLLELSRSFNIDRNGDGDNRTRLSLQAENVGIGPARVLDFRVTVDGTPQLTWGAAMQALLGQELPVSYGQSTISGRTIPPERSVTMFNLANTELAPRLIEEFDRLEFEACFCSIFDECWTTSYTGFGVAKPVEYCVNDEASFTE